MATEAPTAVRVGQVYRQQDPRALGRHLRVIDVETAGGVPIATCVTCWPDGTHRGTRPTRIRCDRLLRGTARTGYRYVPQERRRGA